MGSLAAGDYFLEPYVRNHHRKTGEAAATAQHACIYAWARPAGAWHWHGTSRQRHGADFTSLPALDSTSPTPRNATRRGTAREGSRLILRCEQAAKQGRSGAAVLALARKSGPLPLSLSAPAAPRCAGGGIGIGLVPEQVSRCTPPHPPPIRPCRRPGPDTPRRHIRPLVARNCVLLCFCVCCGYGGSRALVAVVVYKSSRQAQGSSSSSLSCHVRASLNFNQPSKRPTTHWHEEKKEDHGRLCLLILLHHPSDPAPLPLARLRLRPLRAPIQSLLLHLLPHPRRWFVRVWHGGRVPQRRPARSGGSGAVPGRRRLRRVLPGEVQRQEALQRGRRKGGGHRPRQDEIDEPHRPRAQQPGVRRHGPPRHGRGARQAPRRRRRVQEGAVRVRGEEPVGEGGGPEPRSQRTDGHVPLPGRPDRHRRRRRRAGWFIELEVHDAGARAGVEHEPGAAGAAAVQGGGHRRVRREVGLGRPGGPASTVARRRGLRHRGADHRCSARRLLVVRHAGVEAKVNKHDRSKEPKKKPPHRFGRAFDERTITHH